MCRTLIIILILFHVLPGCQTTQLNSQISGLDWLSRTSMPRFVDQVMDAREVAYILRKVGFDPSSAEVSEWIGKQRSLMVSRLLTELKTVPVIEPPRWTSVEPRYWGHKDWHRKKRAAFRAARNEEVASLRQWWISQMLASQSPFGERLVLFWENTFVAGYSGLENKSHAQWFHHQTIRKNASGNYGLEACRLDSLHPIVSKSFCFVFVCFSLVLFFFVFQMLFLFFGQKVPNAFRVFCFS